MRFLVTSLVLFLMQFSPAVFSAVEVGTPAPVRTVVIETGEKIDLGSFYKKGYVLVYFYPKADTPGCTKQACSLRDAYQELEKEGVTIFGASTDNVEAQKAFQKKHRLQFHLISDPEGVLAKDFDVSVTLGFASRQAFLIHDGKIVWLDRKASTAEQAKDVLGVLKNLKAKK